MRAVVEGFSHARVSPGARNKLLVATRALCGLSEAIRRNYMIESIWLEEKILDSLYVADEERKNSALRGANLWRSPDRVPYA